MEIKKQRMPLGKASVEVEFEVVDGQATVLFVCINGMWIDADEFLAEFVVDGWNELLTSQARDQDREDGLRSARAKGATGAAAHRMAVAA